MIDSSTPVTVLSGNSHGSLGIVRSLGALGAPVYVVSYTSRLSPPALSKYCRKRFFTSFHRTPPAMVVDQLLAIGRKIGTRSILIPYADDVAVLCTRYHTQLSEWFIHPHRDARLVEALVDKSRMAALARACGVPTPEVFVPRSLSDVRTYARHARFPVMLKGIDGRKLAIRKHCKMVMVGDEAELIQQYEELEDPAEPNLLIQEYIPANDNGTWMFNGYFNENSECLAAFTGKKLRQIPIRNGVTSFGMCKSNPALSGAAIRFMKHLGYRGMVDIDFSFDARDNTYKVLDVNPRIGGSFRLFVDRAGWDVARVMYLDLTGQRVPEIQPHEGRKWFVEFADLRSFYNHRREASLTLRSWLKSLRGVDEAGYYSLQDPVPFFALLLIACRGILRWVGQRIVKRVHVARTPRLRQKVEPLPPSVPEDTAADNVRIVG